MTFSLNSLHVSNGALAPELLISLMLPAAAEEMYWSFPGELESVRFMLIPRRLAEMMDRTITVCCVVASSHVPEIPEKPRKTSHVRSYRRPPTLTRSSVCCWRL